MKRPRLDTPVTAWPLCDVVVSISKFDRLGSPKVSRPLFVVTDSARLYLDLHTIDASHELPRYNRTNTYSRFRIASYGTIQRVNYGGTNEIYENLR